MPSVSDQCHHCLTILRNIISALSKPAHEHGRVSHDQVSEEVDRFSLWIGNIGALHQPDSAMSVESRLREADDVLTYILSLLGDLNEVTQELLDIAAGERDGMCASVFHANPEVESDDEESVPVFNLEEVGEETELLEEISGTITRLFRVSSLIRQAAPTDLFAKALSRNRYGFNDQFDIAHVGEKYPKLATEEQAWLRTRLGRAITQRRHYLSYIRDHREKLEGMISNDEKGSAVAKSQVPVPQKPHAVKPKVDSASRPSTFFTKATTIVPGHITTQMLAAEESDPEDDARSYTTISRSVDGDLETSTAVRIPTLKDLQAGTRREIECPFCFRMKRFKNERTWRRHVFSDLHSYVCTFPDCDAPYFEDINEWFQHEMQNHRVSFKCMLCKDKMFYEKAKYLAHVQRRHPDMLEDGEEQLVLGIARKPLDQIPAHHCPCCTEWLDRLQERAASAGIPNAGDTLVVLPTVFKRHLASHLEQLAMFAIPIGSEVEGDVASDAAIEEVKSKQSDSPQLSILTFSSSPPVSDSKETNPRAIVLAKRVLRRWKRLVSRHRQELKFKASFYGKSWLLVRGFPPHSSMHYVKTLFEKYGEVLLFNQVPKTCETGIVRMATAEQAQAARVGLHGTRSEKGDHFHVLFDTDLAMLYKRDVVVTLSFWTKFRLSSRADFDSTYRVCTASVAHLVEIDAAPLNIYPNSAEDAENTVTQAYLAIKKLNAAFNSGVRDVTSKEEVNLVGYTQRFLAHLRNHGDTFQERHSIHIRYESSTDGVIRAFLQGTKAQREFAFAELNSWSESFCTFGAREDRHYLRVSKDDLYSVLKESSIQDICNKHHVTPLVFESIPDLPILGTGTVVFILVGNMPNTRDAWTELAASRETVFKEEVALTSTPDLEELKLLNVPVTLYYHLVVENTSEQLDAVARRCNVQFILPEDPVELHLQSQDLPFSHHEIGMMIRGTDVEIASREFEALRENFNRKYGASSEEWPVFDHLELDIVEQWFWQSKSPGRQKLFEKNHGVRIRCDEEGGSQNRHESRCIIFGRKDRLEIAREEMYRLDRDDLDPNGNPIIPDQTRQSSDSISVGITKDVFDIISDNFIEEIKNIMAAHNVLIQFVPLKDPKEARILEGNMQHRVAAAQELTKLVAVVKTGGPPNPDKLLHEGMKDQDVNDFDTFERGSRIYQDEKSTESIERTSEKIEKSKNTGSSPLDQQLQPEEFAESQSTMFQCPVWQMDALRRSPHHCRGLGARSMWEIRQHMHRAHMEIYLRFCNVCKEDILDYKTFKTLHGASCSSPKLQQQGTIGEHQWLTLFRKLYPDAPQLPSPYIAWQNLEGSEILSSQNSNDTEDELHPKFFPFRAVAIRDQGPFDFAQCLRFRAGETILVMEQLGNIDSDMYWGTVLLENGYRTELGSIPLESVIHVDIWGNPMPFEDESKLCCDKCSRYFRSLALRSAHNRALHREETPNPPPSLQIISKSTTELHGESTLDHSERKID